MRTFALPEQNAVLIEVGVIGRLSGDSLGLALDAETQESRWPFSM